MTGNKRQLDSLQTLPSRNAPESVILSKVPEVTIYFWIIKILCTTVGETASDFLNVNLGLGLTGTSVVMGALLSVVIFFQFQAKKYTPGLYWLTVVLISIFGTLVTDNLTDRMGVALELSTMVFSIALALTFAIWYAKEKTLSIHSIFTRQRELFYWLTILFTFALGTASGDLMAESLGLGYLVTGIIICAVITAVTVAWRFGLDAVLAFWIAYILTRPLGASLGDFLSQAQSSGGLGLGATITSMVFLAAILLTVIFLTVSKRDLLTKSSAQSVTAKNRVAVMWQVAIVIAVLMITAGSGYFLRHSQLQAEAVASTSAAAPLGDLSNFRKISNDTLAMVGAGNLAAAKTRVADLESAWDDAEARLKPMNPDKWAAVDDAIDAVLRNLRSVRQDAAACRTSLESLIRILTALDDRK